MSLLGHLIPYLMTTSLFCGLLIFNPFNSNIRSTWLSSTNIAKRVFAYTVYFLASFLFPFSFSLIVLTAIMRVTGYDIAFNALPLDTQVLLYCLLLVPLWLLLFFCLVRIATKRNDIANGF